VVLGEKMSDSSEAEERVLELEEALYFEHKRLEEAQARIDILEKANPIWAHVYKQSRNSTLDELEKLERKIEELKYKVEQSAELVSGCIGCDQIADRIRQLIDWDG
jgi:hypothetical protein